MFLALAGLALSAAPDQRIVINTREPIAPAAAATTFAMTCPSGLRVEIRGLGFARPRGARPIIVINGRPAGGPLAARMVADLSDATAAYRVSPRCDRDRRQVSLIINAGRRSQAGDTVYTASAASITDRGIQSYRGPDPADADSFWYR